MSNMHTGPRDRFAGPSVSKTLQEATSTRFHQPGVRALQIAPTFPANITEKDAMLSYLPLAHIFDRYLVVLLCMGLAYVNNFTTGFLQTRLAAVLLPQQPCLPL